jgi:hypothetical protein
MIAVIARSRSHIVAAALLGATLACSRSHAASHDNPPSAEFLVTGGDSTYWVATGAGPRARVRGVPLTLARFDGRFYEVYVADEDLSYNDALLLGQRVYRRDLLTGDSLLVFADTTVPRVAEAYAEAHPDERPLGPDEDGEADPGTSATAEVDILDIFGPYVSFEYHVDVSLPRARPFHITRRGVIDLRQGKPVRLGDVLGQTAATELEDRGRHAYEQTRDSVLATRPTLRGDERRAADALLRLQFEPTSFILKEEDGAPEVEFAVPGGGQGAEGNAVELDPLRLDQVPPWWPVVRPTLAVGDTEENDRWTTSSYGVVARYDTSGDVARLSLVDMTRREWGLAQVEGPVRRIDFIDRPPIGDADRRALQRAFNAAASYDETARVADLSHSSRHAHRSALLNASFQIRSRKPARNVRADDARTCQQHGPRVRRCHSLDDGQVRRHRGVSAQPRVGGHGVDRPCRFSGADSSRRSRRHESERQLRRTIVDGSRRSR